MELLVFLQNLSMGIPRTGDNSNIGIFAGLGAVSLFGIVAIIIAKKKDDE